MSHARQIFVISSAILASWFGMQATHELGHCLGAWFTGGRIERVVLHPLTVSRTDLSENPHPLIVAWAGPVFGSAAPFLFCVAVFCVRVARAPSRSDGRCNAKHGFPPLRHFLQFFAGFCLISNGLYISLGSFHNIGDSGDLLRHGAPLWHLWLFGILTAPLGLYLWHRLGPRFGFSATTARPPEPHSSEIT
jgi:hypothetical protein